MRHILLAGSLWVVMLLMLAGCSDTPLAISNSDVLYQDTFSVGETGPWQVEGDASGRTAVLDGELIIELDAPALMQFVTLPEPIFTDFVMQVDARILAGSPQSSYGLLFRMQNATQFYRFDITGDGMFIVERRNSDGSWTRFVPDWTDSAAINQGVDAVNQLRVEAVGDTMRFYVNDTLLQQVSDGQFVGGTIGLDAGTFGQSGLQVAFDNLVVQRP